MDPRIRSRVATVLAALALVIVSGSPPADVDAAWEFDDHAQVFATESDLAPVVVSDDGRGGMLVAAVDRDVTPWRIAVNRIAHDGSEVWGDDGILVPFVLGQSRQEGPLALASDGSGGAYVSYIGRHSSYHMRWLVHVAADGDYDWGIPLENLGLPDSIDGLDAQALTIDGDDLLLIWENLTGYGSVGLYGARIDDGGTVSWHHAFSDTMIAESRWRLKSDGQGNALLGRQRQWFPVQVFVQKIQVSDGAKLWGFYGTQVWSDPTGVFYDVAHDGAGGAFVVRSDVGLAYVQHLDSLGNVTWPSDRAVHDSGTAYPMLSTAPLMTPDGEGGAFLVHGIEALYATRFGPSGIPSWGTTLCSPVDMTRPHGLVGDGFGGALVSWSTLYDVGATELCRQVNGARVGADGTVQWNRLLGACEVTWIGGVPTLRTQAHRIAPVADGSGGGLFAWSVEDADSNEDRQVWAAGVDPEGDPPWARVAYFDPEAAEPDRSGPFGILGDYLGLDLDYALVHENRIASYSLTPTEQPESWVVGGDAAFPGLSHGAYHLVVEDDGVERDVLPYALGIGRIVPCGEPTTFREADHGTSLLGSQRQAVYDSEGRLHVLWIEYDAVHAQHQLSLRSYDGTWHAHEALVTSDVPLNDPTLAIDSDDFLHAFCVVKASPEADELAYRRVRTDGRVVASRSMRHDAILNRPVAAVTDDGRAHVVVESGARPGSALLHVVAFEGDVGIIGEITAGASPRDPDLVATNDDLELVFVRDEAGAPEQRVEHTSCRDAAWTAPVVVDVGSTVNSPSVAFDGDTRLLFAWVRDDLLFTQARVGDTLHDPRMRRGDLGVLAVTASGAEAGRFLMLTTESTGGPVIEMVLREGDGNVFFPPQRRNEGSDVSEGRLAVDPRSPASAVYWRDHGSASADVSGCTCARVVTAVGPQAGRTIDQRLRAAPNPFNARVRFAFELERTGRVRLEILDLRGRHVRTLFSGTLGAGPQRIDWDGCDDAGEALASGVYLGRLVRDDGAISLRKVALIE